MEEEKKKADKAKRKSVTGASTANKFAAFNIKKKEDTIDKPDPESFNPFTSDPQIQMDRERQEKDAARKRQRLASKPKIVVKSQR